MTAQLQCPGCATREPAKALVTLSEGRDIRRCTACRLVFAHPMPTTEEIADYYQGFTFGMPAMESVTAHQKLISDNVARIVQDLRAVGCRFGSALDFGGGLGYYADAFASHFQTVDMFDLDRVALEHARTLFPGRFGLATTEPGVIPNFDRKYDLIFANQVIEHYTDLDLFFRTIRAAGHEETIYVITTPNNRSANVWVRPDILAHYTAIGSHSWANRLRNVGLLARNSWACCDPPRHVFAFDPDNLKLIAERHALTTLQASSMYCTDDYYSPAKYQASRPRNAKSLLQEVAKAAIRAAIRILRKGDPAAQRGDDIVLLAKAARD